MSEERCETCRFWEVFDSTEPSDGWCRRYPPTVVADHNEGNGNADFPITKPGEWCGEWQAKRVPLPVVEGDKATVASEVERIAIRLVKLIKLNAPDVVINDDLKLITKWVKGFVASRKEDAP